MAGPSPAMMAIRKVLPDQIRSARRRPMIHILLKRLGLAAVTLFGVAVIVFLLLRVAPGDPIAMMIGPGASAQDIADLKARYGLDKPLLDQFVIWLSGILR